MTLKIFNHCASNVITKKNCHKSNDDLIDCYLQNREAHIRKHAWYLSMVKKNHWDGPIKEVYDSFLIRSLAEAF